MTNQKISDEEAMRGFWEGFGAPDEQTGVRMFQQVGWMDARGSLTESGMAVIKTVLRKRLGKKPMRVVSRKRDAQRTRSLH